MTMYKVCSGCEDKCGDCANIINEILETGEDKMNYKEWDCLACGGYRLDDDIHMCDLVGEEIEQMLCCPEEEECCEHCGELLDDCYCEWCSSCGWLVEDCECDESL